MTPFHALSERLKDTAIRGGRLKKTRVYYFHNTPEQNLYHTPARVDAKKFDKVLSDDLKTYSNVIIVSDAGAARGWFNEKRIAASLEFLKKLRAHTSHVVWLNPMPRSRWIGTSAGVIAQFAPMFEMSRRGLDQAISALRRHA